VREGRKGRSLRDLLAKNPEMLEKRDGEGETPAHHAAKYGELEALRCLVELGADTDAKTNQGATPLHFAAAFGELEIVTFLLSKGAAADPREETGVTPIMAAQAQNHVEVVEVLKRAGANADAAPAMIDLGGGHFVTPVADDDPLMLLAIKKARDELPTLRELFKEYPRGTLVKFACDTDSGQTEHVWAELIELGQETFRARVKTLPVTHQGDFQSVQARSVTEIEDWQVELRKGQIRGGYGFQVAFHRAKEQLGRLPEEYARHEARFIDHDVAALLRDAGDADRPS